MDERIHTIIAGDDDHEELFAEIYVDNSFVGLLSQERGSGNLLFELPAQKATQVGVAHSVSLRLFRRALEIAEKRLTTGA